MAENRNADGLTQGSILRGIGHLTMPMLISGLLQNAQSMIDLFWVGSLGTAAVAAVAVSGTLLMLLFPALMGLATGTLAIVARAVGGGRVDDAQATATQSIVLALVGGFVIGCAGWFAALPLLRLLNTPPDALPMAAAYMHISFLGSFTVFVLFTANAALQGAGDARTPMYVLLVANALNMVLDPLFIFGLGPLPRMEVAGAALATVLAQAAAAGLAIYLLSHGRTRLHLDLRHYRFDAPLCRRILRIGIPGSGQMLSRSLMNVVFMHIVAAFGTVAVAAYGIALRFHMLVLMPAFALGGAAATLMGQNLGAGQPDRARRSAWTATLLDMACMAAIAILFIAIAPHLIGFFTGDHAVIAIGASFLRIVSPFTIAAALAIVLGRALNGAGDSLAPMLITIVSLWGVQIPLALLFGKIWPGQIIPTWWAISIAMTVNGLATWAWFETGRWRRMRV